MRRPSLRAVSPSSGDSSPAVDARGFRVFATGEVGAVHAFIHRCMDAGEIALAASVLRRFLRTSPPAMDSAGVHLHWHQAVLDVTLGRWRAAYERYCAHVSPAVPHGRARTDGPAGLWTLALAAAAPSVPLPWEDCAAVARRHLDEPDPFVAVHDALALAGVNDRPALDRWIALRAHRCGSAELRLGRALRAKAEGDYEGAARLLVGARDRLQSFSCSAAQLGLFERIVCLTPDSLREAA